MKKLTKFLTVFLLALLGANLQPTWANLKSGQYIYICTDNCGNFNTSGGKPGLNMEKSAGGWLTPDNTCGSTSKVENNVWAYKLNNEVKSLQISRRNPDGCGDWYNWTGTLTSLTDGKNYITMSENGWSWTLSQNNPKYFCMTTGKTIYFDNTSTGWTIPYIRYGRDTHSKSPAMTKVAGTKNLWQWSSVKYDHYKAYTIADNYGWTDNNSVYNTNNMQNRLVYYEEALTGDVTIIAGSKGGTAGTPSINYYNATKTSGLKTYSVSWSTTNGSLIVKKYTDDSNTSAISTGDEVLPTQYITIEASPSTGYHLDGSISVTGATYDSGKGAYYVTGTCSISATFAETKHTATIAYMCGSTSIKDATTSGQAGIATTTEITAPEIPGYTFVNWSDLPDGATLKDGDNLSNTTIKVNLTKDGLTLTANYTVDKTMYTYAFGRVTGMTDAMGSVSSSPNDASLEAGTEITVTATLETGYEVEGWYSDVNGQNKIDGAGTANPYVFQIAGNTTVYVKFQETKYTVNVAKGTGVSSVSPAGVSVGQINASENITATPATGYELDGWTLGTGITIVEGTISPIKIKATQAGTITAKAKAKTYTVSFSQEGGTGGQTGTVTATYDAEMPSISGVPTRVGYKFKGYYDAAENGVQYYKADGTSARTWNKDVNTILYAQWTQLYCFIEGRFHVATDKTRTNWTNTFTTGDWDVNSTKIRFTWNETKKRYELATNATLKDLSGLISGYNPDFSIKQSTSSSSLANVISYNHDGTLSSEEGVKNAMNAAGDKYCKFNSQDKSGYVIICFDEKDIWFELDKIDLYDVKITTYGGGSVDPSGSYRIGEITWTINATPKGGYKFDGWTVSGGAKVADKNSATTTVTATGDGEVSANFQQLAKIYFQRDYKVWGEDPAYVYFYSDNYYGDKGSGSGYGCVYGPETMTYIGNNIFEFAYDVNEMIDTYKWDGVHVAITHIYQKNYTNFNGNNRVIYCNNFDACGNTIIKMGDFNKSENDNTAHYYKYSLENMSGAPSSYYIKFQSEDWKSKDENMFQYAKEYTVVKQYNQGDKDEFKVWYNACGKWYGMTATINEDVTNWQMRDNDNTNVKFEAWKTGGYSFKFDINSKQISVTYLGDITVANFPGEVSTFVNRQHKIKPDVTLRNGTKVTDVTITVNSHTLPWTSSYATYEQNGTNLIITGKDIGTENLTVVYKNNKVPPYTVERTLKVNVAEPIVIQAMLSKDEDDEESTKDDYWSNTGLMHIHFWGSDAETAQDLPMSYNKETKVFSVTAPKITNFKFMFWYGEDINMSANEAWRKTQDITDCTTNTCYSISYGTSKTVTRTATDKSGLCSIDEYYVEITMKNGNTYKSNTISDDLSKEVSFFAPKSNDATYTGGTVRIVHNGVVSDPITGFATAGVYVATINSGANGFATLKAYNGNYYIRTDGAGGMWNDYKTNDDNIMIEFTPRAEKGETFSYYWVKNVAKNGNDNDGKTNVKGEVANDYNDNLAGMIENDKFTDGGGFVYNSANGANVRFSYEPTTNEFKRAILGGAGNNNFLNVYSKTNNLYADNEYSKQLSESADLNDSKFSDLSDWVYEKRVYVRADGANASKVILKSVFNGQTTHLLGYAKNEKGEDTDVPNELEVMGSQSTGDFALRITYDFKKNRLIASWEPGQREISENMIIDSDVLFVQQEAADGTIDDTDVAQITYSQAGIDANAKLTSLKNMIYVLEVTNKVISNTSADNQLYWICLPFDCRISDIYGVEGYVKLDAGGRAISGTWGIQRYDGTTRAAHGWFKEDNPEGFWRWMKRDETMKAGTGYVVVFDKTNAGSWPNINVEVACEGESDECKDGKKTVEKRSKRLYFPSIGSKFTISYSGDKENVVQYADEPCNVTGPVDRTKYDGNWKVIGPVSYNNIGVDKNATDNLTFYYTYNQSNTQGNRYVKHENLSGTELLKSFHGYMTQFGGTLTWKPFTKSNDVTPTAQAPLYMENPDFQGGLLTIELNNAQSEQLDRTFINLSKNGTTGFDQNLDLTMIVENGSQIASVSEDVLYAGNTLPLDIELVPLNVKVVAKGTYDIVLANSLEGLEVKLYDAFEQTTTPLDMMSATITLDKGEYKDRFYLQLAQKKSDTPTSFDGKMEQYNLPIDKTQKLLFNSNIYLINGGRVYNATGAELR